MMARPVALSWRAADDRRILLLILYTYLFIIIIIIRRGEKTARVVLNSKTEYMDKKKRTKTKTPPSDGVPAIYASATRTKLRSRGGWNLYRFTGRISRRYQTHRQCIRLRVFVNACTWAHVCMCSCVCACVSINVSCWHAIFPCRGLHSRAEPTGFGPGSLYRERTKRIQRDSSDVFNPRFWP